MEVILRLSERLNFSRLADELYITQPTLSRMIKNAEDELGFAVFSRTTKSVTLTREGRIYVDALRKSLESYYAGVSDVQSYQKEHSIFVLAIANLFLCYKLLPVLNQFREEHKDNQIDIMPIGMEKIPQLLREGKADAGIVFTDHEDFQSDFCWETIKDVRFGVICSEKHPFAERDYIKINDLKGQNIIALASDRNGQELSSFGSPTTQIYKKYHIDLKVDTFAPSIQDQYLLVAFDHGIALSGEGMNQFYPENVRFIPLEEPVFQKLIFMWKTDNGHELSGNLLQMFKDNPIDI